MWPILLKIYLVLLAGVSITGIIRYKIIDTPAIVVLAYLILTTISETLAQYLSYSIKNNLLVYHIYGPIKLLLISIYYNSIISFFKKHSVGIIIGAIGIIFSLYNSIFLQHYLTTFNTNFILIEALLIIAMTLCYFYDFLNTTHTNKQFTTPHFWIACIFLLFWSFTFFRWLTGAVMPSLASQNIVLIRYLMYTINIITYVGFGLVFLFYKKLQHG